MSRRSGRGGVGVSREVQVSKKISWLLRHGAEKEGLKLGAGGYALVSEVLASRTIRSIKVTFPELQSLVATNDKQRFDLKPATDAADPTNAADHLIRANQGHSIAVADDGLLEPLAAGAHDLPTTVVHGTTRRAWPLILADGGLKPMTRNHIHFATGLPAGFQPLAGGEGAAEEEEKKEAAPVISGMRNSSTILVFVDLEKALGMGYAFWRSANGVVLCDGGEKRLLPIECFKRVEERGAGGRILVSDGVVVNQVKEREVGETFSPGKGKKSLGNGKPSLVLDREDEIR